MKLPFSVSVLVAMGLALSLLPTLDAQGGCPVASVKAPRAVKAGRPVTLMARLTNTGSTEIVNGGLALTLPAGVEFSKAEQRGEGPKLTQAGQVLTWTGVSLAPRKTLKIRIKATVSPCAPATGMIVAQPLLQGTACGTSSTTEVGKGVGEKRGGKREGKMKRGKTCAV